jgi:thiamine biosynthesis lipoprotein
MSACDLPPPRVVRPDRGRRTWLRASLGAALAPSAYAAATPATSAPGRAPALQWRERTLLGFGTTLWLRAAHRDGNLLDQALDDAVGAIRAVERAMSLFDADSALSRLNREGRLDDADPHLLAVLRQAIDVARRSDGAFDPSVQPLWRTWDAASRDGRLPAESALRSARARIGWRGIEIEGERVRLRHPDMALTLNGIAQGYAADLARARLQAFGVAHALLDTGEWAPLGRDPAGARWTLGVADPRAHDRLLARVLTDGRCVATSSDDRMRFSADGRHHHILDPRTGDSPTGLAAVTVLAERCTLADALTKVLFMGDLDHAIAQAGRWGVDALAVDKAGRWRATRGLALG